MKEILEMYGPAVLCMLYFLKKDWESFTIIKQIVDSYTDKIKDIIDSVTSLQKMCTQLTQEIKELKVKIKSLENENNDLRTQIKIKVERRK